MDNQVLTGEPMVGTPQSAEDAALLAEGVETAADLAAIATEENNAPADAQTANETPPATEPGWIRKRVDKAVAKAVAETEARMNASFEAMLAPIRESSMEREAKELVASGAIKTLEMAQEYVRFKANNPATAQKQSTADTPRDDKGRFVAATNQSADAEIQNRASALAQQADDIRAKYGVDVMAEMTNNPTVQNRVLSGEWNFYDVLMARQSSAQQAKNTIPPAIRSANGGGNPADVSIMEMSDEQFKKLQQNLATGHRYNLKQ